NEEAGIPPSVRVTTVKPSGTISQVVGVTPGMHHATYEYARRRMIIDKSHPLSKLLIEAEYEHEPLIDFVKDPEGREIMEQYVNHSACAGRTPVANETSLVFTYPIHQGGSRPASRVSAWEQFTQLAMLQREWSDNSVSCTIYFDKETEGPQISQMLAQFSPLIKSVSMLPHNDDAYLQMPYEKIDKEEYEMLVKNLKPIDWDNYAGVDSQQELYCSNDTCEIKTSS
ncbi:MAG: hypothetical protein GY861_04725, partial [bacterium]|nr:hypothetical protein [bacterium]